MYSPSKNVDFLNETLIEKLDREKHEFDCREKSLILALCITFGQSRFQCNECKDL